MTQLYAQPYDTSAKGFCFSKASEYAMSAMNTSTRFHSSCRRCVEMPYRLA
ncbi:hypothetical protein IWQ49_006674 [Labrenzia sp. EL_126]|nr:hypothetical protein [Labrenzia sp. EL_126]